MRYCIFEAILAGTLGHAAAPRSSFTSRLHFVFPPKLPGSHQDPHINHFHFELCLQSPFDSIIPTISLVISFSPNSSFHPKMAMSAAALNPEKFSPFHIYSTTYKAVNEHPIGVDILVPKDLKPGKNKYTLMVRFHGGFLVSNLSSSLTVLPLSMQVQNL